MRGGRNLPPPPPLSTLAEGGGGIKCVFLPGYVVFCRSVGRSVGPLFFLFAVFSFLLPPQARSNVASFVRSCIAEGGTQRRRRRRRGRSIVSLLLLRRRPLATTDRGRTGRQSAQRWRLRPEVGGGRYVASRSKGKGRKREKRKEKALRPFFSSRAEKGGLLWSLGMQVAWYRRRRRERTTSRVGGGRRRVVAAAFSFPSLFLKRPKKKDKREEERSIFAPSILWGKEGWMQSRSSPSLLELSTREACVCRPRSHACTAVPHTGEGERYTAMCFLPMCVRPRSSVARFLRSVAREERRRRPTLTLLHPHRRPWRETGQIGPPPLLISCAAFAISPSLSFLFSCPLRQRRRRRDASVAPFFVRRSLPPTSWRSSFFFSGETSGEGGKKIGGGKRQSGGKQARTGGGREGGRRLFVVTVGRRRSEEEKGFPTERETDRPSTGVAAGKKVRQGWSQKEEEEVEEEEEEEERLLHPPLPTRVSGGGGGRLSSYSEAGDRAKKKKAEEEDG